MTDPYAPAMTGLYDYYSPLAEEEDCDIVEPEAQEIYINETGHICSVAYPDVPEGVNHKEDFKEESE